MSSYFSSPISYQLWFEINIDSSCGLVCVFFANVLDFESLSKGKKTEKEDMKTDNILISQKK
jgi:hypothetical protein